MRKVWFSYAMGCAQHHIGYRWYGWNLNPGFGGLQVLGYTALLSVRTKGSSSMRQFTRMT
jgi:hypothetical protein